MIDFALEHEQKLGAGWRGSVSCRVFAIRNFLPLDDHNQPADDALCDFQLNDRQRIHDVMIIFGPARASRAQGNDSVLEHPELILPRVLKGETIRLSIAQLSCAADPVEFHGLEELDG